MQPSPLEALHARTSEVDAMVQQGFPAVPGLALAAVGGYGRRELFPYSDIDLLILASDEPLRNRLREPLAPYIRQLWDAGLQVSQSVHTPQDCAEFDVQNVELFVSLLDARFLTGDESVYARLKPPKSREVLNHLARLARDRHGKFQNTIYHLEPNIKDGPGGLRDFQILRWARALGESVSIDELDGARDFLFNLRQRMHLISRRDNNVLDFALQDQIDPEDPARLMRLYYRSARSILRRCVNVLDATERRGSPLFASLRDRSSRLSNADFSVIRERVYFRTPQLAATDPALIERLFIFVARHGIALAPDTQDRLLAHCPTLRTEWPAIREILSLDHADTALNEMHSTGVLQAVFPEFLHLDSLVIRDFYHRYTVDEHTLVAVGAIAALRHPRHAATHRQIQELAAEAPSLAVLYLALLFHDVGKGTGEDHTTASARMAASMFERIKLPEAESRDVLFLINAHLELSSAMTSRDIYDPVVARDVARRVGTVERLKYLTLLTYADISAVNPEAMTPWRATLLWNLYTAVYRALTSELDTGRLEARAYGPPEREAFLDGLPVRYLRTRSEADIAMHIEMSKDDEAVRIDRDQGVYRLTVVASDRPFLFASVAGALAGFGMNIVKAEAFSNRQLTMVGTFHFADPLRTLELNPGEDQAMLRSVQRTIRGEIDVESLLKRRPSRAVASNHMKIEPRACVDNSASEHASLIEIVAEDRPGLLYRIASAISTFGCNIEVILIDTQAHRAIDVFYVTREGRKLAAEESAAIVEVLVPALS